MGRAALRTFVAVFACLVAQCQPILAQVSGVKVNSNTGALIDPIAPTFRSANAIAAHPEPASAGTQQQVWFGLRTDGTAGTITAPLTRNADGTITVTGTAVITGTGTQLDPWDAADLTGVKFDALMRMLGRPVSTTFTGAITSVSTAGSGVTISTVSAANPAVVTTSSPHGFGAVGSIVDLYISGVTGSTPAIGGIYRATILSTTTFSIPPSVSVSGSGGAARTPAVVTTASAHGLQTGVSVTDSGVTGSTSTPSVNGTYPIVVTDSTHFEIPANVSVGGTGGAFTSTYGVVPRCTIHIGPGTFLTMGTEIVDPTYSFPAYVSTNYPTYVPDNSNGHTTTGWAIYDGWRIIGSGRGVTTLKLASWPQWGGSPYPYGVSVIGSSDGSLGYAGDDTEIANLSIDCNWQYLSGKPSPSHVVCTAIAIFGDRVHIHDVRQSNMYGNLAGLNEAFSINVANKLTDNYFGSVLLYPTITMDSANVEIDHTYTDGWQGDYGSALAIAPGVTGAGHIHHNYVHDWLIGTSAIQIGGRGSTVSENDVDGAIVGVYSEALPITNLDNCIIYHNRFKRIRHSGIEISGGNGATPGHCDSCMIADNDVEIDFANAATPWAIHITGIGTLTNAVISGNIITKTGSTGGSPLGIVVTNWTGVTVERNTIDSAFGNSIASSTNVFLRGNKDETRAVASGLTDTTLPVALGGMGVTSYGNGILVMSSNVPQARSVVAGSPLVSVTNGNGVSGNISVDVNASNVLAALTPWVDYTPKIPITQSNLNTSSQSFAASTETVIDFRGTVQDDASIAHPPYYQVSANGWYRVNIATSTDGADWRVFLYKNVGGTLSGSNPTTISGGTNTLIGRLRNNSSGNTTFSDTREILVKLSANDIVYLTGYQTTAGGGAFMYYDPDNGTKITIERAQ